MANNLLYPGVVIREVRSGIPQIRGVPTSVAGFIVRTLRGPVAYPIRVSSFAQFVRIFGTYMVNSYSAESVRAFFDNGGSVAYIVRVLGSSGAGPNAKGALTLSASGGYQAMTFTSCGEGLDNNNFSVLATKYNLNVGAGLINAITPSSTVTGFALTAFAANRFSVGDQISATDSVSGGSVRGVVSTVSNNNIVLQYPVVAATGLSPTATTLVNETFGVTVLYNGTPVEGPISNLRMSSLSLKNYFANSLGGVLAGTSGVNQLDIENVVTVADISTPTGGLDLRPINTATGGTGDNLTGGNEYTTFADLDWIGQNGTYPFTGMYATSNVKTLRMLAIPGISGQVAGFVSKSLVQYAEQRSLPSTQGFVGVVSVPLGTTPLNAAAYKNNSLGSTSYGAVYYPWVQIVSPLTGVQAMSPPEGYVMGMWARCDANQSVAKAPAGEYTGQLVDTVDVERVLSDDDKALVYPVNINPIENIPSVGQCVMGSRTLESGQFNQIHVRRTFIYLEQSLKIGTRFVIFEPNTTATRAKLKRATDAFLEAEWRKPNGTLTGDVLAQAFTTVCDTTNNPQVIINAQQMVEDVYVNVPGTVENLIISIQQNAIAAPSA
jgi:phage tail sheath protein FI